MEENLIRIVSYNMHKARGLDQKRRPERTLQVINGLQADVVALQEADKRIGWFLPHGVYKVRHGTLPKKELPHYQHTI